MAKTCINCAQLKSVIEEQKSKIQLLESRLKDVVRAYKQVVNEKNELMSINANITADVDTNQQKRIADLEESVVHLSSICGKFESEKNRDKELITLLENECDLLKKQLDASSNVDSPILLVDETSHNKNIEYRHKSSQTHPSIDALVSESLKPILNNIATQTDSVELDEQIDFVNECKSVAKNRHETAIVAPLKHLSQSDTDDVTIDDLSGDELIGTVDRIRLADDYHSMASDSASVVVNSGVSLFYVNELARKELELSESRLRIREYECSIREMQWKYNNDKYRLQSRIADLELLNSNFMATKSERPMITNTINVAYIRNVLTKLLETKNKEQKQIMINALLTALDSM